ncbi:hypothetical protein K474DRAFT_1610586 [Panus rudis PR-1116 ss-1]|nr:hypothetical protein K474DRAFT_1610586 [Panus rudis PR-1116 ss-1]
MAEVWKDAEDMLLPSWIGRLPSKAGSTQHGKLTADQYRNLCTINLVTTLVRLWGGSADANTQATLDNFLLLVTAIKLAHSRTLTSYQIEQFRSNMHQYLRGILTLYPHTDITPNQHLSLHLPDILKRFGPVHAWRCFPFERYNGMLQNIQTNYKFGAVHFYLKLSKRFFPQH